MCVFVFALCDYSLHANWPCLFLCVIAIETVVVFSEQEADEKEGNDMRSHSKVKRSVRLVLVKTIRWLING